MKFTLRSSLSVSLIALAAALGGCAVDGASSNEAASADSVVAANKTEPAGRRGGPGRHGGGEPLVVAALQEDLGLSAEQRRTIEALQTKHEPVAERGPKPDGRRPGFDQGRAASLAAAIRSGKVDAAALERPEPTPAQKAEHQAKLQSRLEASAQALQTLHATLTPAQRSALVAAVGERDANAPRGKGKRDHGADGFEHGERRGHRGPGKGHGGEHFGGGMFADLELTEAQKQKLHETMKANRPSDEDKQAWKQKHEVQRSERSRRLASFATDDFDAKAFVTPREHAADEAPRRSREAERLAALVAVLEPAQREKLAQRIEQGPPARGEHGGKRGAKPDTARE